MKGFKELAAQDVDQTFLDDRIFAETHDINGERVLCQIDKNIIEDASETLTHPLEGVFVNTITIYVSSAGIEKPVEGQLLSVDDSMHVVRSVSDEMGMLVIVAEANEQ